MKNRRGIFMIFQCSWILFCPCVKADSTSVELHERIRSAIANGHVVNHFDGNFENHPEGEFLLVPNGREFRFGILIYNVKLFPDKGTFSAGMSFREGRSGQLITFISENIQFSFSGGIYGDIKLFLADSVHVNLGKSIDLYLNPGSGSTYAVMDCNGVKEFQLSGLLELDRCLTGVDDSGKVISGKPVNTHFSVKTKHWDDIVVSIDIPPFAYSGLPGFVFHPGEVILDFSETEDLPALKYEFSKSLSSQPYGFWQGLVFEKGFIRLPSYFKNSNNRDTRVDFSNLIIDRQGFCGNINGNDVIDFKAGSLGGWGFSITGISVSIYQNQLKDFAIRGQLGCPLLDESEGLEYSAFFARKQELIFMIYIRDSLQFPALKASRILLEKNSTAIIKIVENEPQITLNLNGQMTCSMPKINSNDATEFTLPHIYFQNLKIQNVKPFLTCTYLGVRNNSDSQTIQKYPVHINDIFISMNGEKYRLSFSVSINLVSYAPAETVFSLNFKRTQKNNKDRLVFENATIEKLEVLFEKSGVMVQGSISSFKGDEVYGSGFRGDIKFGVLKPEFRSTASILFGNVGGFRYWYFDGSATWPGMGIPICTGLNMTGFSGGAWAGVIPWDGKSKLKNPEYGKTRSGRILIPSNKGGFGFLAGLNLCGGTEETFQAESVLEMTFDARYALNSVNLYGHIDFLGSVKTLKPVSNHIMNYGTGDQWKNYLASYYPRSMVGGPFMMGMDIKSCAFNLDAAVFVNKAAGVISGTYPRNKAGEFHAFFSKSRWYLRLGTPAEPLSLSIGNQGSAMNAGTYFLTGSEIPAGMTPPNELKAIFKTEVFREMPGLNEGRKFVLGNQLYVDVKVGGNDKKISLYALLKAKAVNEVSLIHYQNGTICSVDGKRPGINGWYSSGQLYAFMQGKMGARLGNQRVDIFTLTTALAMSYSGPAPFYGKGSAFMKFNITGLLKFSGMVDFELGTPCGLQKETLDIQSIVKTITPGNQNIDVSPLTKVVVDFKIPVGVAVESQTGCVTKYQIENTRMYAAGKEVHGNWNQKCDGYQWIFSPDIALLPYIDVVFTFRVSTLKLEKGVWTILDNSDYSPETHKIQFKTGPLAKRISPSNIVNSWPRDKQFNFYPAERRKGFIQLEIGQPYLFENSESKIIARFSKNQGEIIFESLTDYDDGVITFDLPGLLESEAIVHLRLVSVDKSYSLKSKSNVEDKNRISKELNSDMSAINGLNPTPKTLAESVIYELFFRTSVYQKFEEKIKDLKIRNFYSSSSHNYYLKIVSGKGELFDYFEMSGDLSVCINTSSFPQFDSYVEPLVYESVGKNIIPAIRDTTIFGFRPSKAMMISEAGYDGYILTDEMISKKSPVPNYSGEVLFEINFLSRILGDFEAVKEEMLTSYLDDPERNNAKTKEWIKFTNNNTTGDQRSQGDVINISDKSMNKSSFNTVNSSGNEMSMLVTLLKNSELKINTQNLDLEAIFMFKYSENHSSMNIKIRK